MAERLSDITLRALEEGNTKGMMMIVRPGYKVYILEARQ
jgi:hypothetical protein